MNAKREREISAGRVGDAARFQWQWPDWIVVSVLALLVVTTAFLAAFTTSLHDRIRTLRTERALVTTPVDRASQDLAVALALELDAIFQYALDADTVALSNYRANAAARRFAVARLEPLVRQLDGAPQLHSMNLVRLTRSWEAATLDPMRLATLSPEQRESVRAQVRVIYRAILLEAAAQQESLRVAFDQTRAEIDRAELLIWYFTLGLAALILAASLLVLWLFRRSRGLEYVAERRRLQAETAMEYRTQLIRGITHDVKNPLSTADAGAQLLELGTVGDLTKDQQETVARIRRGIGAALGIISDLLDLARTESGELEIETSSTEVAAILNQATADHRFEAEKNGLALELEVPSELPRVVTDSDRVRQIITNLLSNALKYTPAGGRVTLRADVRSGDVTGFSGRWLAVSVADTGPGILPEESEAIFGEFYRARSLAGRAAGVGLGLSISRKIARLLGGDVTVQSEPGEGSVFTLWLPLDREVRGRRAA